MIYCAAKCTHIKLFHILITCHILIIHIKISLVHKITISIYEMSSLFLGSVPHTDAAVPASRTRRQLEHS